MDNQQSNNNRNKILSVKDLSKYFTKNGKITKVLDELTFDIYEGDFFGVIGESGSGKSTTGKCVIRLYESNGGVISFLDKIINNKHISKSTRTWLCKNMQMIFQDPMSSLNPRKNVLSLISEPIKIDGTIKKEAQELIKICNIINPYFGHTFVWQSFLLNRQYLLPYLKYIDELLKGTIKAVQALTVHDLNSIEQIIDQLNSVLNNLEVGYTTNLKLLFTLAEETKNLIYINYDKLNNHNIEVTETEFYEAKQQMLYNKLVHEKSAEWLAMYNEREQLIAEKEELDTLIRVKYKEQNSVFIYSLIADYKSQAKMYHQKKETTKDLFYYSLNKIKVAIANDIVKILEKAKNDIYLSVDEIREFSEFIDDKVSKKYKDLIEKITALSGLDQQVTDEIKAYIETSSNKTLELIPDLSKWYDSYKEIEKLIDEKIKEDFLMTSKSIKEKVEELRQKSEANKKVLEKEIKDKSKRITNLYNIMKTSEIVYNGSEIKDENQKVLKQSKQILARKQKELENFIALDDKYFDVECQGLVDAQDKLVKELIKSYQEHLKELKKTTKDYIKSIKHSSLKDSDKDFKINYLNLVNEYKNRMNAIIACDVEQSSVLEQIDLYKALRSKKKSVVKSNYSYLKKVITTERVFKALNDVGLKNEHAFRYPHEFSGGQRQRIVIARSLISQPKFIIADEPISALDVSIQAQVVNIMKKMSETQGITFMFIAHDLSMVNFLCNRLIILHKGKIVEKGNTNEIFSHPVHPYTISLIKASPELSKIHVDLSSFDFDADYDKEYTIHNKPKFHKVENETDHYVFCSEEQFNKWTRK